MAAALSLSNSFNHSGFFQRSVLLNVQYWRDFVSDQAVDASTLDREWEVIVKAAAFALELVDAWPVVYDLLIKFTPYMERRGHWHIWQPLLERAIRAAQTRTDTTRQTTLTALLARLLFYQSRFKESVSCYRRAIHLARQVGDHFTEARSCSNLGYYYTEHGQWWRAEVLCCHALDIFEQLDSNHGRAHTENHLGVLYARQQHWEPARQHLERACTIWEAMGDKHGLMWGFLNMSMLYLLRRMPEEVLFYAQKGLPYAQQISDDISLGLLYMNIGSAYRFKGELNQAEIYTKEAELIFRRLSNSFRLASVMDNLGLIYMDQQKWSDSRSYLASALAMWRKLENKFFEIQNMTYWVEYELARGETAQAAEWLKQVEQLLHQYDQKQRYQPLYAKMEQLQRSLTVRQTG